MREITLNEKELIELTVKYGYNGKELENKHFIEKGYLKKNVGYDSFMKKVNSICESVTKQRKKKGELHPTYTLIGLKDVADEIKDNRKFNGIDDAHIKMSKYFFNQLLNVNESNHTFTKWGSLCSGVHTFNINYNNVNDLFSKMYFGQDTQFIMNHFKSYINNRNKSYAKVSIKLLENENKIKTKETYTCETIDNKIINSNVHIYNDFNSKLRSIVESHGYTLFNYSYSLSDNKQLSSSIEKLKQTMGINKIWKSISIEIIDNTPYNIDFDFNELYWSKTIDNVKELKGNKLLSFSDKFKVFNFLSMIDNFYYSTHSLKSTVNALKPSINEIRTLLAKRESKGFTMPIEWNTLKYDWLDVEGTVKLNNIEVKYSNDYEIITKESENFKPNYEYADKNDDVIVMDECLPWS
ncbi:hypothetical protein MKZ17_10930 [Solibacillus sp. FSL R7-0682]|uniref:hypothetical protein n=1 Tax=Solibacillus sp. FSL R7-0682 TaxID=2921690 RepID=UPI0030FB46B1